MTPSDLSSFITTQGIATVMVVWFMWRDWQDRKDRKERAAAEAARDERHVLALETIAKDTTATRAQVEQLSVQRRVDEATGKHRLPPAGGF